MLRALIEEADTFHTTEFHGFSYLKRGYDKELTKEDVPFFQLYAGLGVIVRDIYQYLDSSPRDDSDRFKELVSPIISDNQKRFPGTSMFRTDFTGSLPQGFAAAAAEGNPIVKGLATGLLFMSGP